MSELEKCRTQVYRCTRCMVCSSKYDWDKKVYRSCPPGEHSAGFWTNLPAGRTAIAMEIFEGNLTLPDISDAALEAIYECTLCANCRQQCGSMDMTTGKPLIDVPATVKALRADLFEAGVEVPEAVIKFGEAIEKTNNIFGAPIEERADWLTPEIKVATDADTIFFPGCLAAYR
ncbi:4Fe-4S dicluster domain-containing protein, partial [Chloroflexota bacterium]